MRSGLLLSALVFLSLSVDFVRCLKYPARSRCRSVDALRYRNPMDLDDDSIESGKAETPSALPASGKSKIRQRASSDSNAKSWDGGARNGGGGDEDDGENEAMFSVAYDPLQLPDQTTLERDLEDLLMERAMRFYDEKLVRQDELCYLVGLEDKSSINPEDMTSFTMEESLTELSELAGAAGLKVIGSTYQRLAKPDIQYYIGAGKTADIRRAMIKNKCTCVIIDAELSPSQQKNLEISFNQESNGRPGKNQIKVVDRTALILDIFAQHARTKEGKLQVQLAMLTYRLPRLTNMWTHLERQSAGARGKSNGGVGLRGPGETQLESDRRQMNKKISILNRSIDQVRRHRSQHRSRRRRLGIPVVALVGYTNAGKSTLLNTLAGLGAQVYAADMLFATLDPTTRLIRMAGLKNPDMLLTDTVGFIQKLPTNLVAAFRATLEEIVEADVLLHVTDVNNESWRKQEAAVLKELAAMGLEEKPVVTIWNKIDTAPDTKEFLKLEASKRSQTVALSSVTGEGMDRLKMALEEALASSMLYVSLTLPYDDRRCRSLLSSIHDLGVLEEVSYNEDGTYIRGFVPEFLQRQIQEVLDGRNPDLMLAEGDDDDDDDGDGDGEKEVELQHSRKRIKNVDTRRQERSQEVGDFTDWKQLAKGRHSALADYHRQEDRVKVQAQAGHIQSSSSNSSSSSSSGGGGGGGGGGRSGTVPPQYAPSLEEEAIEQVQQQGQGQGQEWGALSESDLEELALQGLHPNLIDWGEED